MFHDRRRRLSTDARGALHAGPAHRLLPPRQVVHRRAADPTRRGCIYHGRASALRFGGHAWTFRVPDQPCLDGVGARRAAALLAEGGPSTGLDRATPVFLDAPDPTPSPHRP